MLPSPVPTIMLEDIAQQLRGGRTSSIQLVEKCLTAIKDPAGEGSRAFIFHSEEKCKNAAAAADLSRAAGGELSRFHGIPISIKDNFDVQGEVTQAGSIVLQCSEPAKQDAVAVRNLRQNGFVIVGRTNMSEFACSGLGLNKHYGTPANRYDRISKRIPGGSSSGAAVSVTDGMACAAVGSDTGGSCRIPAALCGLVGFKPSNLAIDRTGMIPLSPTLDCIGVLGWSVSCVHAIHWAMAKGNVPDPIVRRSVSGLRMAVVRNLMFEDIEQIVYQNVCRTIDILEQEGVHIFDVDLASLSKCHQLSIDGGIAHCEAFEWHENNICPGNRRSYDPRILNRINRGSERKASEYLSLLNRRNELASEFDREANNYDVLLFPTVPIIAPEIESLQNDDRYFERTDRVILRNSATINMAGGCAISIPMYHPGSPPCGVTLATTQGKDYSLLSIAAEVEHLIHASFGAK